MWIQARVCYAVGTSGNEHDLFGFALVLLLTPTLALMLKLCLLFRCKQRHYRDMQQNRTQSHGGICDVLRALRSLVRTMKVPGRRQLGFRP